MNQSRSLESDEPRATRAQLHAVIENIDEGLVIVNADGRVVTINETARQMIGYAPGEERSHHAREFAEYLDIFTVDGRQLLPEERPIFRVLAGDSFSDYELVCRQRRSGREWIASFVGTPVRDETGAVQLAVLSARDITERKRAERELQDAARQKDAFLAMLAHELRNPLAPILSAAEVLPRLQPGSPGQASAVEIIERQARHMARIVDDLLDVSRITTGRILLRREVLDLRELAEATVGDHRPALDQRGLRLDLRLAPEPAWVDGDRTRLAQVLDNLLVNAEKFTDPGGSVAVEVALEGAGTDGVLTVRDSGIGMEPDVLTHLFEPFSQGDRTLARSPGGLGLGMALVKGLVNMHGGDVTASSAGPGGGSEFRIRLPIVEAPAQDQPSAALPATDGVGAGAS